MLQLTCVAHILPSSSRQGMARARRAEEAARLVAPAVMGWGTAPRVAKFQAWPALDQPSPFSALTRAWYWVAPCSEDRWCLPAQWYAPVLMACKL